MKATSAHSSRRPAGMGALAAAAATFVAGGAQAQADPCEQLKGVLAARIPPEVRGYSMETVPANAPVPPGAKAIGNCGASKILYRRWGGSSPPSRDASAVVPSPVAPAKEARRQASAPADGAPKAAEPPAPAASIQVAAARVMELPPPSPPAAPAPSPAPATPAAGTTPTEPVVARAADTTASAPQPAAAIDTAATGPSFTHRASAFLRSNWRWFGALALLPMAVWLWAWLAHRRAYDASGLPRGPRL